MNNIVKADVVAHASELSTGVTDTAWADILDYVNQIDLRRLTDSAYDTRMARIYLAAHIIKLGKTASTGAVGPVVSESAGGVRRSYAFTTGATESSSLTTTKYGQTYLEIIGASQAHGPFLI